MRLTMLRKEDISLPIKVVKLGSIKCGPVADQFTEEEFCKFVLGARLWITPHRPIIKDVQRDFELLQERQRKNPVKETYIHELKLIDNVEVKRATKYYDGKHFDKNEFYRMESKPRGIALIIVNTDFDVKSKLKPLNGGKKDFDLMTQLFGKMGYQVISRMNQTKAQIEETVQKITSNSKLKNMDSCVVAISSHGCDKGFSCSDGSVYQIQSLTAAFNNKNCPQLSGKPKIFFIQACRGSNVDPGVSQIDVEAGGSETGAGNCVPSVSDVFIVRAPQDGFVSYVNNSYGSWLFYCIIDVFMNFACRDEFTELMRKVHRKIQYLKSTNCDMKQAPELSFCGDFKRLYFNPGLRI